MAPALMFDLAAIDLNHVLWDKARIESVNPHRDPFRMLDGLIWHSEDYFQAIAFKQIGADEFWVPGHIPGRPLFPGVLMVEAAAQLASLMSLTVIPEQKFLGFAGIEKAKFRGQVQPGDRLYVLGRGVEFRKRRSICECQGVVNGNLVFEATIHGMSF